MFLLFKKSVEVVRTEFEFLHGCNEKKYYNRSSSFIPKIQYSKIPLKREILKRFVYSENQNV